MCFPSWLFSRNVRVLRVRQHHQHRFQHPPHVQPTSPASPANCGKSEDSIKGAGGLGRAAAPLGGGGSPSMMIEKLGAKNLKSNGRMMIEKVMIQLGAKSPKIAGGLGGAAAPTMIEKAMIQLGPKKKKSSGGFISSSAARPHGTSEDSITGKLIPVRHLKRGGGGGGGNFPNDA